MADTQEHDNVIAETTEIAEETERKLSTAAHSDEVLSTSGIIRVPKIVLSSPYPASSKESVSPPQQAKEAFVQEHRHGAREGEAEAAAQGGHSGDEVPSGQQQTDPNSNGRLENDIAVYEYETTDDELDTTSPDVVLWKREEETNEQLDKVPSNRCMDGSCLYEPDKENANYFAAKNVVKVPPEYPPPCQLCEYQSMTDPRNCPLPPDSSPPYSSASSTKAPTSGPPSPVNENHGSRLSMIRHMDEAGPDKLDDKSVASSSGASLSHVKDHPGAPLDHLDYWEDPYQVSPRPDDEFCEQVPDARREAFMKEEILAKLKELISRVGDLERRQEYMERFSQDDSPVLAEENMILHNRLELKDKELQHLKSDYFEVLDSVAVMEAKLREKDQLQQKEILHLRNIISGKENICDKNGRISHESQAIYHFNIPKKEENAAYNLNIEAQDKIAELKLKMYDQQRLIICLQNHLQSTQEKLDLVTHWLMEGNLPNREQILQDLKDNMDTQPPENKPVRMSDVLHCDNRKPGQNFDEASSEAFSLGISKETPFEDGLKEDPYDTDPNLVRQQLGIVEAPSKDWPERQEVEYTSKYYEYQDDILKHDTPEYTKQELQSLEHTIRTTFLGQQKDERGSLETEDRMVTKL